MVVDDKMVVTATICKDYPARIRALGGRGLGNAFFHPRNDLAWNRFVGCRGAGAGTKSAQFRAAAARSLFGRADQQRGMFTRQGPEGGRCHQGTTSSQNLRGS
jgi:hypothetical protein